MEIPLREPGETRAESVVMYLENEAFNLEQSLMFRERSSLNLWYISASSTKHVPRAHPLTIRVLPRPPKMEISCPKWEEQYYTDEPISLGFDIENGEDIEAVARLDVLLFGEKPPTFAVDIPGREIQNSSSVRSEESKLSGAPLGAIESSKSLTITLRLPPIELSSRYDLTLKVTYFLSTNPGTPISQTANFQLNVVNPFEANYELVPRVHPDPWPSLFDHESISVPSTASDGALSVPKGISQAWCLVTRYASFASEPLRVVDIDVSIHTSPTSSIQCTTVQKHTDLPVSGRLINPKTIEEAAFDLVAQKSSVDDRSHASLDMSLIVKWTRQNPEAGDSSDASPDDANSAKVNTTTLPVPRFTIFGTEPRVLASVSRRQLLSPAQPLVTLTVTIENGSNHFLTFGLVMEPSEQFAFSGPKQTTLNLLPVSRRSVEYRMLPLKLPAGGGKENEKKEAGREEGEEEEEEEGGVWIRPGLVVRDKYFQKILRVIPGGEGVRADKDGFEIWVPLPGSGSASSGSSG
jgi:hypothetical protein